MPRWPKSNYRPESVHFIETYSPSEIEKVTLVLPKTGQKEFLKLRLRETHELEKPITVKIKGPDDTEVSLIRRTASEISSEGEFFVSTVGEVFFLYSQEILYVIADYWGKGSIIFAEDLNELMGGAFINIVELVLDPGTTVTIINPSEREFPLITVFELIPRESYYYYYYGYPGGVSWVKTDAHLSIKNVSKDSFDVTNLADVEKHFVLAIA